MRNIFAITALVNALTLSPQASADVMLGAYLPGDGWSRSRISDFNDVTAKPLSFVNVFTGFSYSWNHLYWQSSNIFAEGAMPLISLMPIDSTRRSTNLLPEILAGDWDAYLDTWGSRLKSWAEGYAADNRPTVLLRFGHEFNGDWYSYGDDPYTFAATWRYVHDRFNAIGANAHIEWVWSANYVNVDSYDDMTLYYPGDNYVDWTSLDGYNWGSNYSWTSWKHFSTIFSDAYHTLVDNYPDKPIMLAEVASAEEADLPSASYNQCGDNSDAGESKSAWVAGMMSSLETEFPAIRAISLFNITKELSWGLESSHNTGLLSYNAALQSDYFASDFLSATEQASSAQLHAPVPLQHSPVTTDQSLIAGLLPSLNYAAEPADVMSLFDIDRAPRQLTSVVAAKGGNKAIELTEQLKTEKVRKRKVKVRKISKVSQRQRANGKRPRVNNPAILRAERDGFRGMSSAQKGKFKHSKVRI